MKSPPSIFLATSLFLTSSLACAQTVTDLNEGLSLAINPTMPSTYEVSWWGKTGRTYFIGHTDDLRASWSYFPVAEYGQNAIIRYAFTHTAPSVFVRLRYYEEVLADPFGLDGDGDGLTNQQEFTLGTDPFDADTDGDGLPDGWEVAYGLDPRDPTGVLADPDSDGRSSAQEFLEGTNPMTADTSPPSSGPAPAAPTGLTAEVLASGAVQLRWNADAALLGYLVERSSNYVNWELIGFTSGSTTTYDDTTVLPGVAYAHRIKGVY